MLGEEIEYPESTGEDMCANGVVCPIEAGATNVYTHSFFIDDALVDVSLLDKSKPYKWVKITVAGYVYHVSATTSMSQLIQVYTAITENLAPHLEHSPGWEQKNLCPEQSHRHS